MGDCSMTRSPPGAVLLPHQRDQEAARSNKRASLIPVPVTSQWCAQEAADQAAYKLRVHDGLLRWSPTCSRTIMKVCSMLLAAVSAPRV